MTVNGLLRFALTCVLVAAACAQTAQTPSDVIEVPDHSGLDVAMPKWDHGYLLFFRRSPTPGIPPQVWSYDMKGAVVVPPTNVAFPDAYHADIRSQAAWPNGTIVVSAEVWDSSGQRATVLASVARGGKLLDVVRTQSFVATHLAVDSKGQVWAAGVDPDLEFTPDTDYPVLQRYDLNLRLASTLLRRKQFTKGQSPTRFGPNGSSALVAAGGHVALYTSDTREWIEFDESGGLLSRFAVDPVIETAKFVHGSKAGLTEAAPYRIRDVAMTQGGCVYAWIGYPSGSSQSHAHSRGLYQLDRSNHKWVRVNPVSWQPYFGNIYGVAGNALIMRDGCCRFGLFTPPDILN